jgi:hypothetical protein
MAHGSTAVSMGSSPCLPHNRRRRWSRQPSPLPLDRLRSNCAECFAAIEEAPAWTAAPCAGTIPTLAQVASYDFAASLRHRVTPAASRPFGWPAIHSTSLLGRTTRSSESTDRKLAPIRAVAPGRSGWHWRTGGADGKGKGVEGAVHSRWTCSVSWSRTCLQVVAAMAPA